MIWVVHSNALHLTLIKWKISKVTINLSHGGGVTLNEGNGDFYAANKMNPKFGEMEVIGSSAGNYGQFKVNWTGLEQSII